MSSPERCLWRAFPWDARALPGAPFSAGYVPPASGRGRFDLPVGAGGVLYLAEAPEHALGESLQPWRGRRIGTAHLRRGGLPLTLVPVRVAIDGLELADLCEPHVLASLSTTPDAVASRFRATTQPIAKRIWSDGFAGLRWWSTFWGDWHSVVLFTGRAHEVIRYGEPEEVTLRSPALAETAHLLGMEVSSA